MMIDLEDEAYDNSAIKKFKKNWFDLQFTYEKLGS